MRNHPGLQARRNRNNNQPVKNHPRDLEAEASLRRQFNPYAPVPPPPPVAAEEPQTTVDTGMGFTVPSGAFTVPDFLNGVWTPEEP